MSFSRDIEFINMIYIILLIFMFTLGFLSFLTFIYGEKIFESYSNDIIIFLIKQH